MSNRKSLLHLRTLPPVVVALAGVGFGGAALAQAGNPTTGATLYNDTAVPIPGGVPLSCKNCHGTASIFNLSQGTNEAAIVARMSAAIAAPGNAKSMNQYAAWTPQMRADVASYIATATAAPPPPPLAQPPGTPAPAPGPAPAPVPPSAAPTLSPDTARFSSTVIGKESATSGVQVTNSTAFAVRLATPAVIPPRDKPAEFLVTTAPSGSLNCVPGYTLEPGTSCSFGVRFAPLATGTRTEKWTIAFTDDVPAREVMLEGTATGSVASTSTTAPTGSSAANAPTGGAGALGWTSLLGLSALAFAGTLRRRVKF